MEKTVFAKKLGKQIAILRREKEFTQVELAKQCKQRKQNINRLESGGVNPSAFFIYKIAKALDVPIEKFFDF